jgi:serine protease Do
LLPVALGAAVWLGMSGRLRWEWPQTAIGQAKGKPWVEKTEADRAKGGSVLDPAALNKVFVDLAQTLSPAVVSIYTKTRVMPQRGGQEDLFRYFFGNPFGGGPGYAPPPRESQSQGSGFVINTEGFIVTNSHVVRQMGRNMDSILVKFNTDSERSSGHEVTVVGVDELTDVAVLKLKKVPRDLRVVPFGNSDKVQVGEWVLAIGNPYGHSHSVSKGIVSALGRAVPELNRSAFLQTDASINPGNSGGPLFNLFGEVIGINTAVDARAQGIGFAIPINTAKNIVAQIVEKGEVTSGYLGVVPIDLTPEIAAQLDLQDSEGVLIQEVTPGDPADRGGLRAYDVVRELNGKKVDSAFQFRGEISSMLPGSTATVSVLREGRPVKLALTVGKRPSARDMAQRQESPAGGRVVSGTGLSLAELSPAIRQQLGVDRSVNGVVVVQVRNGSPASEVLAPGDILQEINRKPVRSVAEAEKAFASKKKSFLLKVRRGQGSVIAFLDLTDDGSGAVEQEER